MIVTQSLLKKLALIHCFKGTSLLLILLSFGCSYTDDPVSQDFSGTYFGIYTEIDNSWETIDDYNSYHTSMIKDTGDTGNQTVTVQNINDQITIYYVEDDFTSTGSINREGKFSTSGSGEINGYPVTIEDVGNIVPGNSGLYISTLKVTFTSLNQWIKFELKLQKQ